jgi:secreted trypsin-like serine protease
MKKLVLSLSLLSGLLMTVGCAPQNQSSTLGNNADNIVGGKKIDASNIAGQSTVGIYARDVGYICTGTLVAPNVVLTAGHCVDLKAKEIEIMFAPEMKNAKADQIRKVVQAVIHPQYAKEVTAKDMYDVALMKFEGKAPVNYKIAPMLFDRGAIQKDVRTIVAGYGLNWTIGPKSGAGTLRTTDLRISDANYSNTEVMLDQSITRGICSGDSGGPAYLSVNGVLHVWGVASRGDSLPGWLTPKCMLFSIFTRVDAHQAFIQDTITLLQE